MSSSRSIRSWAPRLLGLVAAVAALAGEAIAAPANPEPAESEPPEAGPLARPQLELVTTLEVEFHHPPEAAVLPPPRGCGAYVAGRAGLRRFDVVLVLDTSGSTSDPSGGDIDDDGEVGRAWLDETGEPHNSDPGDSVLAAEISAARRLLSEFDANSTRVGLVAFAGSDPRPFDWLRGSEPAARTLEGVSPDHLAVEAALVALGDERPDGGTDLAAAIDRAVETLTAEAAGDLGEVGRHQIVMLFTDGYPNLPFGPDHEARNLLAVFAAANRASDAGIEVHTFAIGEEAVLWPLALIETSDRTGGSFTPVRHPADLADSIQHSGVGRVSEVVLRNATTEHVSLPFRLAADGAFQGFVEVVPGVNVIEVSAEARPGEHAHRTLSLRVDPEAEALAVPAPLLRRQTALLEDCLNLAERRRAAAEASRAEELRRKLAREIERERELARERARNQRKRLELDAGAP